MKKLLFSLFFIFTFAVFLPSAYAYNSDYDEYLNSDHVYEISPVDSEYAVIDGVLFDKTVETLLSYPPSGWYEIYPNGKYDSSYEIPESVTAIGEKAFKGCCLESVSIPNCVTVIGDEAFSGCSYMTTFSISDNVTSVGEGAFADSGIESFDIGSNHPIFEVIDGVLFDKTTGTLLSYPKTKLEALYKVPERTKSIGKYAFKGCLYLTSVTIPDSITSIGSGAFAGTSISSFVLNPNHPTFSVTDGVLFDKAAKVLIYFASGKNDTSYAIPNGTTSVGDYAFYNCYSLTNVTFPDSVTFIGDGAFYGCGLQSVIIPDSVASIGDYTFAQCGHLTSVTIPNSVTTIGNCVFSGCCALTSIIIPDGVKSIGNNAFSSCDLLASVIMPDSVVSIGSEAFFGCQSLTTIIIPRDVTSIADNTFFYCFSLTSVTIPDSVTSIGDRAFYMCRSLSSVEIPDCVTSIGGLAFFECESLTSFRIPSKVVFIGEAAFNGCSSLTSLTIPSSVTSIGERAFSNIGINSFVVSPENPVFSSIDDVLFDNMSHTLVAYPPEKKDSVYEIPKGTISIGVDAFRNNHFLTSVIIPYSITSIGDRAFYMCQSLSSAGIPNSVTFIGENAFDFTGSKLMLNVSRDSLPEAYAKENGLNYSVFESTISDIEDQAVPGTLKDVSPEEDTDSIEGIYKGLIYRATQFDDSILLPNLEDMIDPDATGIKYIQGKRGGARAQSLYDEPNGKNKWAVKDGAMVKVYAEYKDHFFVEVMMNTKESEGTFAWVPTDYVVDIWSSAVSSARTAQY